MLPFRLADDLCSLRADVPRLAMVIEMRLDDDNNVVSSKAHEAVILVKENLAYEETLEDTRWDGMFELADSWQEDELRLNIQNGEQRPRIHGENALSIEVKWPNRATKMIETFMVKTNNIVGDMLGKSGAVLPWRCHPMPDSTDVQNLNKQLEALEISIQLPEPRLKSKGQDDTDELAGLLGAWAGQDIDLSGLSSKENKNEIDDYLANVSAQDARDEMLDGLRQAQEQASALRSSLRRVVDQGLFQLMNRARYDAVNIGHFGLNLDAYAHFTSPIRRYSDIVAHRMVKGKFNSNNNIFSIIHKCNNGELRSQNAERDYKNLKGLKLLDYKKDDPLNGYVTKIQRSRIIVNEECSGVDGIILKQHIPQGSYEFHKDMLYMRNKIGSEEFKVGDKITIKVSSIDIISQTVLFNFKL